METKIDLYPDAWTTTGAKKITLSTFLDNIRSGYWQDQVLPIRAAVQKNLSKKQIDKLKTSIPAAAASGTFKVRNSSPDNLEKHSGYLAIDIDHIGNISAVKEQLMQDSLFHALFISCSGRGICGLVRINPKAHIESFNFMSEHMFLKYGLNIDEKCKDVSRLRFVSYDPDLYVNQDSQIAPIKPTSKKERQSPKKYLYTDEDFQRILDDIKTAELDLTGNYQDWIYCGFSLVDKFGEEGRDPFHTISMFHPDYDPDKVDYKYDHLLKSKIGDHTIDWFYHIVEKNGLTAYGKGTADFIQQELAEKRAYDAGLREERPLTYAMLGTIDVPATDPIIQVKNFVHKAYKIRKNEMTAALEVNGEMLDDELLNTIYILCRSVIEKINGRDIIYHVLDSRFTPRYHLVKDMMSKYEAEPPEQPRGHIKALVDTLETDTVYAHAFIKKWLVALIASAYGQHSVLELILQGPQNCGKTEWFRRLLPPALLQYYAESKMDEGKDDLILMSKKLIIMDDELSGKSKQEERKMKSISSKQTLDLRVPFGRTSSTLNRIAMLAGTANDDEIVDDPTGNRRRIVIGIKSVNFEAYNAIDKELLLYECYLEYMAGFNYQMATEDILLLESGGQQFKKSVVEEELLTKYFCLPADLPDAEITEMSSSEVFDYIRPMTRHNINSNTLGKYLKKLGFEQKHRKNGKTTIRKYLLVKIKEITLNDLV